VLIVLGAHSPSKERGSTKRLAHPKKKTGWNGGRVPFLGKDLMRRFLDWSGRAPRLGKGSESR